MSKTCPNHQLAYPTLSSRTEYRQLSFPKTTVIVNWNNLPKKMASFQSLLPWPTKPQSIPFAPPPPPPPQQSDINFNWTKLIVLWLWKKKEKEDQYNLLLDRHYTTQNSLFVCTTTIVLFCRGLFFWPPFLCLRSLSTTTTDPNLRNLLSCKRTINIMMSAALRKKKRRRRNDFSPR